MSSSFFDYFTPPKFLQMSGAGVAFSDHTIRMVNFKMHGKGLLLDACVEQKLPQGLIEGGFINNPKEVVSILKVFKEKHNLEFVRATLPEEKAYLFKTQIPRVDESEIRQVLEFKIQENVPLSPAKAVFDYTLIPTDGSDQIHLAVAVLPQKVVAAYTEVLTGAGLVPLSFYTESQAVARSVIAHDDMGTSLVVHFQETKTIFFIVSHGVVQYASTLQVGGNALTLLIQKYFKVTFEEAEKVKRQKVFSQNEQNAELLYSLVNELSVVKDEVVRLVNYWRSSVGGKDVLKKIILCGEDAMLAGIDKYLSLHLECSVEVAQVWINAFSTEDVVPGVSAIESLNYVGAIGAALPE